MKLKVCKCVRGHPNFLISTQKPTVGLNRRHAATLYVFCAAVQNFQTVCCLCVKVRPTYS